jgi:hypothetical protein
MQVPGALVIQLLLNNLCLGPIPWLVSVMGKVSLSSGISDRVTNRLERHSGSGVINSGVCSTDWSPRGHEKELFWGPPNNRWPEKEFSGRSFPLGRKQILFGFCVSMILVFCVSLMLFGLTLVVVPLGVLAFASYWEYSQLDFDQLANNSKGKKYGRGAAT